MMLHQNGHTCDTCDNGIEALDHVRKRIALDEENEELTNMYELIIMDFAMEVCDGPTATRMIRNLIKTVEA